MVDFLSSLNPEQREAVLTTEGPLLIHAGAGSGKTRVIAHRTAYLIAEKKVPSWNILAVTFTNKAAQEMRLRVQKLLRDQQFSSTPWVLTFHSLCVRILRQDIEKLGQGYDRTFTIYDQDDSVRVVKNCIKDLGIDQKLLAPRPTLGAISAAKNRAQSSNLYAASADYLDERRAAISRVYELYESRLRDNNALDFDDLLLKTVRLLENSKEVREKYNHKFQYILVDEYQDTNPLQFRLIELLTQKQKNICVVGDEDQSIYKWRGADISNILNFESKFPGAKTIRLEQNYRSTQVILDAAGSVVGHNFQRKGKSLWTSNPRGERVRYHQAPSAEAEARFVAQCILDHRESQFDIRAAVLYRTNSQSRLFEEAMRRVGLSYNIVGGFSFYERREVRDITAYLKLALNPNDSVALQRVINSPPRGIGKSTIEILERRAKDAGVTLWEAISQLVEQPEGLGTRAVSALKQFRSLVKELRQISLAAAGADARHPLMLVSDVVKETIIRTGYDELLKLENTDEAIARLDNLQELVNAAVDYDDRGEEGLREFIDHAALVSDADDYKQDVPVTLMTAHSAKGLEFPLVFIVGLEQGIFPHSRSVGDEGELEEERRLAYVAMTRAEKYLYVTHATSRRIYGAELASEPSQFLNEMPLDLIEDFSPGNSWLSFARSSKQINYDSTERKKFTGKTYDNVASIQEFFNLRGVQMGQVKREGGLEAGNTGRSGQKSRLFGNEEPSAERATEFVPGSYVRHAKYGRGLVLRREGAGDSTKLTVSFPGYGQKKLIQKYAALERD